MANKNIQVFDDVFDAIADSPEEALYLKVKSKLLSQISEQIKNRNLTQKEAAIICKTSQARISSITTGKLAEFTIDTLVKIAFCIGLETKLKIKEIDQVVKTV